MKKLLNTLYVTSPDSYLSLDGETVVVLNQDKVLGRVPLHNLEGIVAFGYTGASPALMGECANRNISLCFLTPNGRFLARVTGRVYGNVTLRKEQYRISDDPDQSCKIAKNFITGKVYNARWVIERVTREHSMSVDCEKLKKVSAQLQHFIDLIRESTSCDQLRGYEGEAHRCIFQCLMTSFCSRKIISILKEGLDDHQWIESMRCCHLFTHCSRIIMPQHWKPLGSILMLAFCIQTAPAEYRWHWT